MTSQFRIRFGHSALDMSPCVSLQTAGITLLQTAAPRSQADLVGVSNSFTALTAKHLMNRGSNWRGRGVCFSATPLTGIFLVRINPTLRRLATFRERT